MEYKFGPYLIKTHELESKLSLRVSSKLGEVSMHDSGQGEHDFPNAVGCKISNPSGKIKAKAMKKLSFGSYKIIIGINYSGDLVIFHSPKLNVARKIIDGADTLSLSLLKEP